MVIWSRSLNFPVGSLILDAQDYHVQVYLGHFGLFHFSDRSLIYLTKQRYVICYLPTPAHRNRDPYTFLQARPARAKHCIHIMQNQFSRDDREFNTTVPLGRCAIISNLMMPRRARQCVCLTTLLFAWYHSGIRTSH